MKVTPLLLSLLAIAALAGCVNETVENPAATPIPDSAAVVPVPTPNSDMLFEEVPDNDVTDDALVPDETNAGSNAASGTTPDSDINNGLLDPNMNSTAGTDANAGSAGIDTDGTNAAAPDTASADTASADWSLMENNVRNAATRENGVEDAVVVVSGDNRCLVALKMKPGETLDGAAAQNIIQSTGTNYSTKITTDAADYAKAQALRADGKTVDDNAFSDLYEKIKAAL